MTLASIGSKSRPTTDPASTPESSRTAGAGAGAKAVKVPVDAMVRAVRGFKGLAHRSEWVLEHEGVAWVNASKGTNVGAVRMGLEGFSAPVILIAGGQDKGGDFSPLRGVVRRKVKHLVLLGEARDRLREVLGGEVPVQEVGTIEEAVAFAAGAAAPGDVVLLSPACASFDQFRNFEERGEVFKEAVRCLQQRIGKAGSCSSAPRSSS